MKDLRKSFKYSIEKILPVKIIVFILLVTILFSCKKFLEVGSPKDRLVSAEVFKDDRSAIAAMVGVYSDMMQTTKFISANTTWFLGLNADELAVPSNSASQLPFVRNELTVDNAEALASWNQGYQYIYYSNAILEGLKNASGVSETVKTQLMGEAKFTRAFVYFYLTNVFGDVPLLTSTDYEVNAITGRSSQSSVYSQMINDLKEAQLLLSVNYPTADRVRPNRWAATALLARIYLYTGDWANAEIESGSVINSGNYSLATLQGAFLKGSNETIWQLYPVAQGFNTHVAPRLVPSTGTAAPIYSITTDLVNSFESGDLRKTNWLGTSIASGITHYYSNKYKVRSGSTTLTEYFIALRLAEQYLIRAEARAKLNTNLGTAIGDVNTIRLRAGLGNLSGTLNDQQILSAIEKERRSELFTEMGHRWFDLKRTGRIDAVLGVLKPTWKPTAKLWPIPLTQLNRNQILVQNPGYN